MRGDDAVRARLPDLAPVRLLTSPVSLNAIALLPGVPSVTCSDTALLTLVPCTTSTCAIPRERRERHGTHRYGRSR
ncbi:hypothetical protein [Actinokineospora inagensis]|uniref:hypothetical protein n=1 Tax=Actinokineospora inagensis TaxID=103730 RepID=UPI003CCBC13B